MRTGTTLWAARPTAAAAFFPPITRCLLEQQTSGTRRPAGALNWGRAGGRRVLSCPNLGPYFTRARAHLAFPIPKQRWNPSSSSGQVPEASGADPLAEPGTSGSPGLADADCGFLGNSALWRSRASTQSETGRRGPSPSPSHSFGTVIQGLITSGPFFCAGLLPFPICTCTSEP